MYQLKFSRLNVLFIIIILFVIFIEGVFYYLNCLMSPVSAGHRREIEVNIPQGATTDTIARKLEEKGLINNAFFFRNYVVLKELDAELKAGEYLLSTDLSMEEIIDILRKGATIDKGIQFTIPEGYTLEQIAYYLQEKKIISSVNDFIKASNLLNDYENFVFVKNLPANYSNLEGYLFPDTYRIKEDTDTKMIVSVMLERFEEVFNSTFYERAQELNMTVHEVVTLASIIEREAMVSEERPLISAVFHNRLKKGMLLQSCASVQYALGEVRPVLTYDDLRIDSPYNTYIYYGLPPGPIASPGVSSLEAALYPKEVDYLYFVAKKDGSGEHYFSTTASEHYYYKEKAKKNHH